MSKRTATWLAAVGAVLLPLAAANAQVTPKKAADFIGLMGVTSGFDAGNVSVATGKTEMDYMGVKMFRDMCNPGVASTYSTLLAAGYNMVCTVPYGASVSGVVTAAKAIQNSYPGQLVAIEGMNEPGNFGFTNTANGGFCGDDGINGGPYFSDGSVCATFMQNLYSAVKADSVLGTSGANIPIWGPTQTYFANSDVGLQWIADSSHPMLMDVSTVHPYLDSTITVYDSLYPTTSVEIQAQHGNPTYLDGSGVGGFPGYTNAQLLQKSYAFTEAGCNIGAGGFCTTTYHRKMALKYWADAFLLNYKGAMIYQLHDGGGTVYGFYDSGGTARSAADDAHNLSTILADSGAVTLTPVNVSVTGMGSSGHWFLLRKNSGTYYVVAWHESGSASTTVNFGGATSAAPKVYNPQTGTTAVQTGTLGDTSATYSVPDYPVVFEFAVSGTQQAMTATKPTGVVAGTAFTLSGTYTGTAPSALDYSTDGGANWTAATSTIGGGTWSFSMTIATATSNANVTVRNRTVTTVQASTGTFVVSSGTVAEAITVNTPANVGTGVSFAVTGGITGTPAPTALQYQLNGGTWTAATTPTIGASSYTFNLSISPAGTYTLGVRDTNHTSVTATSGSFVVSDQTSTQQWDSAHKNASITLSTVTTTNDKATFGGTTSTDRLVLGKNGVQTTSANKKVYWEVVPTQANSNPAYGIGLSTTVVTDGNWLGDDTTSVGWDSTGAVYYNGGTVATIQTYATGNTLGFALDTGNCKLWMRTGTGNWNNSGTDNPATNTGGYSLNTTNICASGKIMQPGASIYSTSQTATAHFAGNTLTNTPPSGFLPWDGSVQAPPTHTMTVTYSSDVYTGGTNPTIAITVDGVAVAGSPVTASAAHTSLASTTLTVSSIADGTHNIGFTFTNGTACSSTNSSRTGGQTAWINSIAYDGVSKLASPGVALPCSTSTYSVSVP